jgi:DNA-binding NarL/FixJ family response regulator
VLDELARGRDNPEIAETLAISKSTVKAELRALYRALGVTRRSEAVAVAFRLGIIS